MSRVPKKSGAYTSYGSLEHKHVEVSAFQKKLNETVQLAKENEEIGREYNNTFNYKVVSDLIL
jgi:hypothetical protein